MLTVFEHPKQDVVLSEQHGSFMQPTSTQCPICNKHEKRINFDGSPAGFTLNVFPGRQAASERALNAHADLEKSNIEMTIAGEPVNNAEQVDKQGDEPVFFAVPDPHEITAEAPEMTTHSDLQLAHPEEHGDLQSAVQQEPIRMHFRQVIPLCNPADPLTTVDQLAALKQGRATRRPTAPSLTTGGTARVSHSQLPVVCVY